MGEITHDLPPPQADLLRPLYLTGVVAMLAPGAEAAGGQNEDLLGDTGVEIYELSSHVKSWVNLLTRLN